MKSKSIKYPSSDSVPLFKIWALLFWQKREQLIKSRMVKEKMDVYIAGKTASNLLMLCKWVKNSCYMNRKWV